MGETVEFASNGAQASGYLARAKGGEGPGVLVLQEWWGLVPQIKGVSDRLADEGFSALAPDLYHGEMASHTEMDKAGELMSSLPPDRAARDMGGAVDFLLGHEAVRGDAVGVVGFCMGGMLSFVVAAQQGGRVGAAVSYYGAPLDEGAPDWSGLTAPVLVHVAENDEWFPLPAMQELESTLKGLGKDVTLHVWPGTGHAFGNEEDPLGTHDADAAAKAWDETVAFVRKHLT